MLYRTAGKEGARALYSSPPLSCDERERASHPAVGRFQNGRHVYKVYPLSSSLYTRYVYRRYIETTPGSSIFFCCCCPVCWMRNTPMGLKLLLAGWLADGAAYILPPFSPFLSAFSLSSWFSPHPCSTHQHHRQENPRRRRRRHDNTRSLQCISTCHIKQRRYEFRRQTTLHTAGLHKQYIDIGHVYLG